MMLPVPQTTPLAVRSAPDRGRPGMRPQFRPCRIARFAVQNLVSNIRRTALALVGVAVGLAAVTGLNLVSLSSERLVRDSFADMPLNLISLDVRLTPRDAAAEVTAKASKLRKQRAEEPAHLLRSDLGWIHLSGSMTELAGRLGIAAEDTHTIVSVSCDSSTTEGAESVTTVAVESRLLALLDVRMDKGRALHPLDAGVPWVTLGHRLAQRWSERVGGGGLELGQPLLLCGNTVYLAGIMSPIGSASELLGVTLNDAVVMMPQGWIGLGREPSTVTQLWRLANDSLVPAGLSRLQDALRDANVSDAASVHSARSMLDLRTEQVSQTSRMAGLLVGISLLIGGVGIMNVMLVSGLERRYDIAVCMALGADRLSIGWQFLVESTLLGLVGGAAGLIVGLGLGSLALVWLRMPLQLDLANALISLLLGAIVGAGSGLYPAIKVARLDCAELLAT